jgi:hypothetical protein
VSATIDQTGLPIEAQTQIVDDLMIRCDEVFATLDQVVAAGSTDGSIIKEVTLRAELEKLLSAPGRGSAPRAGARARSGSLRPKTSSITRSPTAWSSCGRRWPRRKTGSARAWTSSRTASVHAQPHGAGEYDLALSVYTQIENSLQSAESDDRRQIVLQIRGLAKDDAASPPTYPQDQAEIGGIASMEGSPLR